MEVPFHHTDAMAVDFDAPKAAHPAAAPIKAPMQQQSVVPDFDYGLDTVPAVAVPTHHTSADPFNAPRTDADLDTALPLYYADSLAAMSSLTSGGIVRASPSGAPEDLREFISRVISRTRLTPSACAVSLCHLARLLEAHPHLTLGAQNVHRMAVVSLMIAGKCVTDVPYSNKYWAKVSGEFTLDDINAMEAEFVRLLGWDAIAVGEEEYREIEACAVAYLEHESI